MSEEGTFLDWRLKNAHTFRPGQKQEMIDEGCEDYEWVDVYRSDRSPKKKLPVDVIWENGTDTTATIIVDIPDGNYRVDDCSFEGEALYIFVKNSKIDEQNLVTCAAAVDWCMHEFYRRSWIAHLFYESVYFDVEKNTVKIEMGS
jgi:hypothetical protein